MQIVHKAINHLRARLRRSLLGNVLYQAFASAPVERVCFVAATRSSEADFWAKAPLAISLKPLLKIPGVGARIFCENRQGLPAVYNQALREIDVDCIVFLHDDVWLNDAQLLDKLRSALKRFDIVGVAGNVRRVPKQPAWLFKARTTQGFDWDSDYLSGAVAHGKPGSARTQYYGPTPAACELMDGVFLAIRRDVVERSRITFDEHFDFHFYDMDFCRSSRAMGLVLGTWPIDIIHASAGAFGTEGWLKNHAHYMQKWEPNQL